MDFIKPKRLSAGDTVALLSPSWGGPSAYPGIFEKGIRELEALSLNVKEYRSTRMDAALLQKSPRVRAEDFMAAFEDPDVKGIFTSIGGDDSVRVLDFVDWQAVRRNPKVFMGFSDSTTLLATLNLKGLVSFHGPSVMAGIAQIAAFDGWREHLKAMLFTGSGQYQYDAFDQYAEGYPDWSDAASLGGVLAKKNSTGWRWLQGEGVSTGTLFGGCIEVLEFLKSTRYWPGDDFWPNKVLFFETSEEVPSVKAVTRMLRNYGIQGIFQKISALLFGRAHGYSESEKLALDRAVVDVVAGEFDCSALTIVSNMDFGHTVPQFLLPLGAQVEINSNAKTFRLCEPAVLDPA